MAEETDEIEEEIPIDPTREEPIDLAKIMTYKDNVVGINSSPIIKLNLGAAFKIHNIDLPLYASKILIVYGTTMTTDGFQLKSKQTKTYSKTLTPTALNGIMTMYYIYNGSDTEPLSVYKLFEGIAPIE